MSEWHSIPAQFHPFKTVGNILLWRLFWCFLCFAVPWFRLFCSPLSKICLRELWVLCHADALFQISHCQVVRGPTVSETYTAAEKKGNGKLIF